MPAKAPSLCRAAGCNGLTTVGWCERHIEAAQERARVARLRYHRKHNRRRDASDRFYGTQAWRNLRDAFIRANPLCSNCECNGLVVPAQIVDHKVPRKKAPELSLEWSNLRSLCRPCHGKVGEQVRR